MIVIELGFYAAAVLAMTGLCILDIRTATRIAGTAGFICALAAFGLAYIR